MIALYLARHAQSLANQTGQDMLDPPLTELGKEQAIRLGDGLATLPHLGRWDGVPVGRLGDIGVDRIYTSPMRRSIETAQCLMRSLGAEVIVDQRLAERGGIGGWCDRCSWGGLPKDEIERLLGSKAAKGLPPLGWWFRGVETERQLLRRVGDWLDDVIASFSVQGARIVAVGHGALFDALGAVALGHPDNIAWMSMHNAAVSRLDFDGSRWRLVFWNDRGHLRGCESY